MEVQQDLFSGIKQFLYVLRDKLSVIVGPVLEAQGNVSTSVQMVLLFCLANEKDQWADYTPI